MALSPHVQLALAKSKLVFQSIYLVHDVSGLSLTKHEDGISTSAPRLYRTIGLRSLADTLFPKALMANILEWHSDSSKHTEATDMAGLASAETDRDNAKNPLSISIRAKNVLSNVLVVALKALYLITLVIAVIARTAYHLVISVFFLGQAGAYAVFASNTQTSLFANDQNKAENSPRTDAVPRGPVAAPTTALDSALKNGDHAAATVMIANPSHKTLAHNSNHSDSDSDSDHSDPAHHGSHLPSEDCKKKWPIIPVRIAEQYCGNCTPLPPNPRN